MPIQKRINIHKRSMNFIGVLALFLISILTIGAVTTTTPYEPVRQDQATSDAIQTQIWQEFTQTAIGPTPASLTATYDEFRYADARDLTATAHPQLFTLAQVQFAFTS